MRQVRPPGQENVFHVPKAWSREIRYLRAARCFRRTLPSSIGASVPKHPPTFSRLRSTGFPWSPLAADECLRLFSLRRRRPHARWGEKYTDSQLATMKTTLRKLTIWLRAQSLGSKRARCPRSGGLGLGWVLLCSTLAAGGETRYVNLNNPTPALPTPPGLRPLPTSSTP